jgi:hypothetical protein
MEWKYFYASVTGTSHKERDIPLQDYACVKVVEKSEAEKIFIAAVADGAGSASHSYIGSKLACKLITNKIANWLKKDNSICNLTPEIILEWLGEIQIIFNKTAERLSLGTIRQLATTLLVSIVDTDYSFFFQVGDGAIVVKNNSEYKCIFWPQNGEYANTTYFITDENVSKNLMINITEGQVKEFAMLTDGVQVISINYMHQLPSERFFNPFFTVFENMPSGYNDKFSEHIAKFLDTDRVNAHTDDDKTLLIASCI